jgi:hypothetical protein
LIKTLWSQAILKELGKDPLLLNLLRFAPESTAVRKIAEETKNHGLERDFYIEERKAERGVYWRQLVEELKKAPEELKNNREDIDEQKGRCGPLATQGQGVHRPVLGIVVKIAQLILQLLWIAVMFLYWAFSN